MRILHDDAFRTTDQLILVKHSVLRMECCTCHQGAGVEFASCISQLDALTRSQGPTTTQSSDRWCGVCGSGHATVLSKPALRKEASGEGLWVNNANDPVGRLRIINDGD